MAIDWLTRKIYWTDSENNRIEVVGMDKPHYRAVVVHEDLDQPRAVVVGVKWG
jgi:low density lipoprotein receptor-related protein 5/6